ncbi:MAG: ABC transporter permease [Dehalococcoidia bacterium]
MNTGLTGYALRRLLWTVPVLFAVSVIVFYILRLAPTSPVDSILGTNFTEEQAARLRQKYGYDEPIHIQYFKYMQNLFQGDPGVSVKYRDFSMKEVVFDKMWISFRLNVVAVLITFGLGIPIGIYAALARGTFVDPLTIGFWLLLDAIPVFVMAPLLSWLLAIKFQFVSLSFDGLASPNIILPIVIMSLPGVAGVARFMRASVLSVIGEDYVRTARAKGLRNSTVVMTHITRNALLPMVTVVGLTLPALAGGSLFVEQAFGIPGIGQQAFEAALTPDYDVILVIVLFGSTLFVLANVLVDLVYGLIDPRVRVGRTRG